MGGEPSTTNVKLVQTAFDGFARRDLDALVRITDPEVEFFAPTALIANEGRCYRGHAGIGRYLQDVELVWSHLEPVPEKFREVGNHVVALGRMLATARDGLEIDAPAAWVWQIRAGKLVWGCAYANPGPTFMGLTFEGLQNPPTPGRDRAFPSQPAPRPAVRGGLGTEDNL
jgi:ketosteroid isomerase-like protein